MSTLTYTETEYAVGAPVATRKGLWRRAYDAIMRSQQRRAEQEIARYVARHGGLFTDDMEREIMHRLEGRRRSL
jgi:hypothetical protein